MEIKARCIKRVIVFGKEFVPDEIYTFDQESIHTEQSIFGLCKLSFRTEIYKFKTSPDSSCCFFDRRTCEREGWLLSDIMGNLEPMLCFEDYFYVV